MTMGSIVYATCLVGEIGIYLAMIDYENEIVSDLGSTTPTVSTAN